MLWINIQDQGLQGYIEQEESMSLGLDRNKIEVCASMKSNDWWLLLIMSKLPTHGDVEGRIRKWLSEDGEFKVRIGNGFRFDTF